MVYCPEHGNEMTMRGGELMTQNSCSDVCEALCELLVKAGYPINTENEDHSDVLEALAQVKLIPRDETVKRDGEPRGYWGLYSFDFLEHIIEVEGFCACAQ